MQHQPFVRTQSGCFVVLLPSAKSNKARGERYRPFCLVLCFYSPFASTHCFLIMSKRLRSFQVNGSILSRLGSGKNRALSKPCVWESGGIMDGRCLSRCANMTGAVSLVRARSVTPCKKSFFLFFVSLCVWACPAWCWIDRHDIG